jgi:lipopolysaccharide transport system permease protein
MSLKEETNIRIIRPDNRVNEGVGSAIHHIAAEVWAFRSHIRIVFGEQFRAAYSGTGLGVFWNYVLPLLPLTIYWFLARMRVFPNFEGVDGAAYLTFGITLWFLFAGLVQTPIQVVQARNKESMKTSFPLSASIVSGLARLAFDTIIRIALVAIVIVFTHSWPQWNALLLPLVALPAFLLFVGTGLLLGILNVIYNDVSRLINIVLQYGIFISGVLFPLPEGAILTKLNLINPFAVFIEACREIVFLGAIEKPLVYALTSAFALLVFALSVRLFFVMEYRVRGLGS